MVSAPVFAFVSMFWSVGEMYRGSAAGASHFTSLAAIIAVAGVVVGTLLQTVAHILRATLIIAVNTSGSATDADKEEFLETHLRIFHGWTSPLFGRNR
jgi:hypothetical protein